MLRLPPRLVVVVVSSENGLREEGCVLTLHIYRDTCGISMEAISTEKRVHKASTEHVNMNGLIDGWIWMNVFMLLFLAK